MMAEFWRKKEFKKLSKIWNKKLAEVGFEDAEIELKEDRALKQRASNSYRQASQLERESRLEYYSLLGSLTNNTKFQDFIDKTVMMGHSEGKTIKEIVNDLEHWGISRDRKTVRYIIRRWQMRWGIKHWNLKQMNLKKVIG
jgi:hypothetical protein